MCLSFNDRYHYFHTIISVVSFFSSAVAGLGVGADEFREDSMSRVS